jgi:predicted secreted Zn-dependent protease
VKSRNEITLNTKPQVEKSRVSFSSVISIHGLAHGNHAGSKTAGREITQQITGLTETNHDTRGPIRTPVCSDFTKDDR